LNSIGTRPEWVSDELLPFESRYLGVGGSQVHYIDEGTGPVLLFLHGNPTWSFLYRNIIAELRDAFRCIALDYPGFGLSTAAHGYGYTPSAHADVVERFVLDLDLHDVTLMGQDWGGPIGLTVATRHPDRFSGFVLGNTWAWPLNGQFHFEAFSRMMGGFIGQQLVRNTNFFVNVMIPMGTASRLSEDVMRAYRGPFSTAAARMPTSGFAQQLLSSESFMRQLQGDLDKVNHLPALFVWGGGDFALRAKVELPQLEERFSDHTTIVFSKARHFFQEDVPQEVASAIREWMGQRQMR